MKPPKDGLIIELFAGGGGAGTGIRAATGRSADVALNHDETAMAVYRANHKTRCMPEDIWKSPPLSVTGGRPVELLWASPDCTHFSRAKGGKPKDKNIRALAHVIVRWARDVRPRVIFGENVREFFDWGPLYEPGHVMPDGRVLYARGQAAPGGAVAEKDDPLLWMPIPERKGEYFNMWRGQLELLGYRGEFRPLVASQFGAPTSRTRLYFVFRCDGEPIYWPEPSHGPGLLPMRAAAEVIDWNLPCPSIFLSKEEGAELGVKRPLADATMRRIAEGVRRYVLESPAPFVVGRGARTRPSPCKATSAQFDTNITKSGRASVVPTLIQTGYGERAGQRARVLNINEPLGTIVAGGCKHALVSAFLAKHYGGNTTPGTSLQRPLDTITTTDHHALVAAALEPIGAGLRRARQVHAFLMTYYSSGGQWQDAREPLRTITTNDRLSLVTVNVDGAEHVIVDIGMRMLEPHELLGAQFGRHAGAYDLSPARSKKAKVRLIGNSVCPEVAEALVRANLGDGVMNRRAA
ncbi:DNA cytosine methyltransferase [Myxococcus landrumensis]|uniref:DNA (cytosine-5-)-methyltransferase n=1 Tax=Myxococcus landrumensis TaxID=2813577 RepID=A0ABX7NEW8_9BACT|nr:DNA cytosine methyltransferase [Myxococcus landrumus]QSQ17208.1 DNA cytosine methyltransferase [Myxococcus landrumus]